MIKIRRKREGVVGGVYSLTVGKERIPFTYKRPDPRDKIAIEAEIQMHFTRLVRYSKDVERYMAGVTSHEEAPRLEVTVEDQQSMIAFIIDHLVGCPDMEDEDTGEVVTFADLDEDTLEGLLIESRYDQVITFAKAIIESNGLPKEMADHLEQYVDILAKGGCPCQRCAGTEEEDPTCRLLPLEPLNDVVWCLDQHRVHIGEGSPAQGSAGWLVDIHRVILEGRRVAREREASKERQREIARKHGLIK
jgi:hypothetical protein